MLPKEGSALQTINACHSNIKDRWIHYAHSSTTHPSNKPKDKRKTRTRSNFIRQASRKQV